MLRQDFIFHYILEYRVRRHLDADLLSRLYILICIISFQEMSSFSNAFDQGIFFFFFFSSLEITLDRSEYFEEHTSGEIVSGHSESLSFLR